MWWRKQNQEVAEFLYKLLVTDAPKGYGAEVAANMGVAYPTLAKYWTGRRRFPAALVPALFRATGHDPRVAEFFLLRETPFRLSRTDESPAADDVGAVVSELAIRVGRITELYVSDAGAGNRKAELEALIAAAKQLEAVL